MSTIKLILLFSGSHFKFFFYIKWIYICKVFFKIKILLIQVFDERQKRLNEAAQLERHIMQAQARAMSADERELNRVSKSCDNYSALGLPPGTVDWKIYAMVLISLCSWFTFFRKIKPILSAVFSLLHCRGQLSILR